MNVQYNIVSDTQSSVAGEPVLNTDALIDLVNEDTAQMEAATDLQLGNQPVTVQTEPVVVIVGRWFDMSTVMPQMIDMNCFLFSITGHICRYSSQQYSQLLLWFFSFATQTEWHVYSIKHPDKARHMIYYLISVV